MSDDKTYPFPTPGEVSKKSVDWIAMHSLSPELYIEFTKIFKASDEKARYAFEELRLKRDAAIREAIAAKQLAVELALKEAADGLAIANKEQIKDISDAFAEMYAKQKGAEQ